MAPTMDIDKTDTSAEEEDAAAKSSTAAAAAVTTANSKPKKKSGSSNNNPSASSETASLHPDMALAQDIHRLTMIHTGKLSIDDATTSIIGCLPQELLDKVMARVGTGGKSLEEAMMENEAKYKPNSGSAEGDNKETATTAKVDDKNSSSSTTAPEPLLNPSLYRHLQSTLSYYHSPSALTDTQLQTLTSHHESMIQAFNDAITKAKDEAGDMEVLHAHMDMARYHAKCSTKEEALAAYQAAISLPKLSVGKKLDAHLEMARVCSFYSDYKRMKETLSEAAKATAKGGDWDRRNRLKVYQALNFILVRDMESASKLLVEGIATFSCTELCDYSEFIVYAIITALLNLKRTELKKCIIDGSEVLQVAKDIPVVIRLANTLYDCDYKAYLHTLVDIQPHLIANRYLQPHAGYLLRELHVLAYQQFLDSYQSVTLESMANSFGVGSEYLDAQLSRFIAAGRLTAKIDKYGGVVETNRPDWKNARYKEMIQKGDLLLNRIQKLGRVVDL